MNLNELSFAQYKKYCLKIAKELMYDCINADVFKEIKSCKYPQELARLMEKYRRLL